MLDEKKGTCCHKCGHVHVKGTSCPTPFLKGERSCVRRTNEVETTDEGLWANINAKRARGEKGARKGSEAYKAAVAAGNKLNELDETDSYCPTCLKEYLIEHRDIIEEAEYRGRKVQLGKPFYTPGGPKKRSVYVKNAKGNVVKVNFGDPNLKIKKNIPARRKSFRARHKCDTAKDRTSPRYWSCKFW
jgi:hypothetical protein